MNETFDMIALPEEEQAKWREFSAEHPEESLDEIDSMSTDDYYPLPQSWGPGPDKGVEYSQRLLECAQEIRTNRDGEHGSKVPKESGIHSPYVSSLREEINLRTMTQKVQVYEIGRCLCLAKQALDHGRFLKWLLTVNIKKTSALNAMRIYRVCCGCPELLQGFSSVQLYVLCAPAFPKKFREMIFDEKPNNLPKDAKEIAKLGRQYKASMLPLEMPEIKALFDKRARRTVYRKLEREVRSTWVFLDKKIDRLKAMAREQRPEAICVTDEERKCYDQLITLFQRFAVKLDEVRADLDWDAVKAENETEEKEVSQEIEVVSEELKSAAVENSQPLTFCRAEPPRTEEEASSELMSEPEAEEYDPEETQPEEATAAKNAIIEDSQRFVFLRTIPAKPELN
jgi:hypothetical protein